MTPTLDAAGVAEALFAQAEAYETYRTQQRDLSDKAWKECHGDATPPELALAAAIRAYLASAEPAGWRTMESAPKDRTTVDLWVVPCEDVPAGQAERWFPHRVANTYYADYRWFGAEWPLEPTHWQPLPAAPTPQGDETK